jgi:hypothetical protein
LTPEHLVGQPQASPTSRRRRRPHQGGCPPLRGHAATPTAAPPPTTRRTPTTARTGRDADCDAAAPSKEDAHYCEDPPRRRLRRRRLQQGGRPLLRGPTAARLGAGAGDVKTKNVRVTSGGGNLNGNAIPVSTRTVASFGRKHHYSCSDPRGVGAGCAAAKGAG